MLSGVCARLASALRGTRAPPSAVALRCLHASSSRPSADKSDRTEKPPRAFDQALLEFLVCPLSKKPLRLMGNVTVEECGHHLNPLMNLRMNKSETTRNNALKYGEVKINWAWNLLYNT
ncbi:PREDICTED: protein preY, mitochondrial isoform X1 [Bison bison bison]|uniref:Protein preY, mitochondrial isoform X1 n=1 Tax=Bison bison bison TaxID=43346 RepID=A0A6P3IVV1_BISBB|nr:PREDICTED: protein preY, mitochondrial isoform X1 [Bison bison bison]XP_027399899.1 protein preY, mitochondrial isoform X2 [Bos indicus x Bos taurus]